MHFHDQLYDNGPLNSGCDYGCSFSLKWRREAVFCLLSPSVMWLKKTLGIFIVHGQSLLMGTLMKF